MLYVYLRSLFQNLKNSYFFHIYIFFLGNSLPQDICCMAADGKLVFAAYGNVFSAFARNKEVCITELSEFVCLLELVGSCHDTGGSGGDFNVAILHLGHSECFFFLMCIPFSGGR